MPSLLEHLPYTSKLRPPHLPSAAERSNGGEQPSDALERWLSSDEEHTLGDLADQFGEKSFAFLFIVLLGVPALPLPTGGVTHVFEAISMLLALQLIGGRRQVWLPGRWRRRRLDGPRMDTFLLRMSRLVRWLERHSRPRMSYVFDHRISGPCFGAFALAGAAAAFLAPPFTGLDTLPALGVVVLSVGVLARDAVIGLFGILIGSTGIAIELAVGRALLQALRDLF